MDLHRNTAARRSKSYWLLSRFFLEEVDQAMLGELSLALQAAQVEGRGDAGEFLALQAVVKTVLDSPQKMSGLQAEFARLLRDLVPQAASPDHVGSELRVMSILCFSEMQAWRSGDELEARTVLQRELGFLDDHLLPWIPRLCRRLAEVTTHPFCLALTAATALGCRQDRDDVDSFIHGTSSVLLSRAAGGSATPASSWAAAQI
jgi:TorA maturation chaperone TorD